MGSATAGAMAASFLCWLAMPASAVPVTVPYIADIEAGGAQFNGAVTVTAALYGSASGGAAVWGPQAFGAVSIVGGRLELALGSAQAPLDSALVAPGGVWLELVLGGVALSPRQQVLSVPYARLAANAQRLGGLQPEEYLTQGDIDVQGSIAVNGVAVIGSDGAWVGPGGPSGGLATTGPLTLYVNGQTGADSNDGLTLASAKQTIQAAVDSIPTLVRHSVTVKVAPGVYRDAGRQFPNGTVYNVSISDFLVTGSANINIVGDTAAPATVRITGSNAGADSIPVRNVGLHVSGVQNVQVNGVLFDRFTWYGLQFNNHAVGSGSHIITRNNSIHGTLINNGSIGTFTNLTSNSNGNAGLTCSTTLGAAASGVRWGPVAPATTTELAVDISGCSTSRARQPDTTISTGSSCSTMETPTSPRGARCRTTAGMGSRPRTSATPCSSTR